MQVREIMTPDPACCTPDTTLQEVARMMEQNDCGLIPVVESRETMRPVGTITDRDITIRAVAAGNDANAMKAGDIMTRGVATVRPDMSLEDTFDVMEDREIRRVLVVDERGRVCGIVAQADIVQSPAHPARTNKVIREISESSPSRGQRASRQTTSGVPAYLKGNSLVPLLIGLGSGAALTYLLNKRYGERRGYIGDMASYAYVEEDFPDTSYQETVGRYPDAEEEIESRRRELEERLSQVREELESTTEDQPAATSDTGDDTTTDRSQTVGRIE
jgi:CBS domain-containing protein